MRHLDKNNNSKILGESLDYKVQSHRPKIREYLKEKQKGLCAYSEKYIDETTSVDIEHFDGRLKDTPQDSYYNWYAVLNWLNLRKPKKIAPYLPIAQPYDTTLKDRIEYKNGIYQAKDQSDKEAQNFIDYLGLNKFELKKERDNSVKHVKFLFDMLKDEAQLKEVLKKDKLNLGYYTALEAELGIDLSDLI